MRRLAADVPAAVDQTVTIAGWVHRVRLLGKVAFVIVRDRTGLTQVVVRDPDQAADLEAETVVRATGRIVANDQAPGGYEMVDPAFEVVTRAQDTPPIDLYRPVINAQLPTLLDHAPVTLRHPRFQAIHRISSASARGFRDTLTADGFTEIFTPKLVASQTESGANVFKVKYFDKAAFLAQSPQFYKQIMVGVYERVFEVAPVFRAEPHNTARHLAEYVSLDAELGFVEDHFTVMAVLRDVIAGMVGAVAEHAGAAAAQLEVELPAVPDEIPHLHFRDALDMLSKQTGEDLSGEVDLAPAHERAICDWARDTHGSEFVFVTGYPMSKRPFYTHPEPADPRYANGFDLLFRGLELVTGGQRLHRYDDYVAALEAMGEPLDPYRGYLETFRYGMPPHGGFAIGLERFVSRVVGLANIREATLFPRDTERLIP